MTQADCIVAENQAVMFDVFGIWRFGKDDKARSASDHDRGGRNPPSSEVGGVELKAVVAAG